MSRKPTTGAPQHVRDLAATAAHAARRATPVRMAVRRTAPPTARFPRPRAQPLAGHLGRWGLAPLPLLDEGARLGPVFEIRLWRRAIVGYSPAFNRQVLRDLDTFRSKGSLSRLTPYLNGGVVLTDVPAHTARRALLNPPLSRPSLEPLRAQLDQVATSRRPDGVFDALEWSGDVVRAMLNGAFFDHRMDDGLLDEFLRPLHRSVPHPFLPRPLLQRRIRRAIDRQVAHPSPGTLSAALADIDGAAEEIRIALAAAYDTTAHTLTWALWHLADSPGWRTTDGIPAAIDETLRLYPAGWLGSRVTGRDCTIADVRVPADTLVLYSPYLTHRDQELWPDPLSFRPERFAEGRPGWGFIPFSAGPRTCLGAHLARAMLSAALQQFVTGDLRPLVDRPEMVTGLTLRPRGPVTLERRGPRPLSAGAPSLPTPAALLSTGLHPGKQAAVGSRPGSALDM